MHVVSNEKTCLIIYILYVVTCIIILLNYLFVTLYIGSGLAFFAVGYAFAYGGTPQDTLDVYTQEPVDAPITFIGTQNFFLIDVNNYAFWLYQYAFAATSTTIVAGTLAERCQMTAYLLYSTFLTSFVYPIIAHNIWSINGFLTAVRVNPLFGVGMIDFAGSGVVSCFVSKQ